MIKLTTITAALLLLVALALHIPATHANGGGDNAHTIPPKPQPTYPNLGSELHRLATGS